MQKKILHYLGITAGGIIGVYASNKVIQYQQLSQARRAIEEQNKALPKQIDELTKIIKMNLDDNSLEYVYEVDNRVPIDMLKKKCNFKSPPARIQKSKPC